MSDIKKETLSALFDGETSDFETQRLLQGLDESDKKAWKRYQIMRMATNKTLTEESLTFDVSEAVFAAISGEPMATKESQKNKSSFWEAPVNLHWLKPAAGFAAAASVTFFVVVGVLNQDSFMAEGDLSATKLPLSAQSGLSPVAAKIDREEQRLEKASQRQFNAFYREHFLRSGEKDKGKEYSSESGHEEGNKTTDKTDHE